MEPNPNYINHNYVNPSSSSSINNTLSNPQNPLLNAYPTGAEEAYPIYSLPQPNIDDEYWKKFPAGYRFYPRDGELIVHYLRKKVLDQPLPPNKIAQVNIYRYNPEQLAEDFVNYKEDDSYYFFTPRDRKYRNGDRPSRAAGGGYWKATGANKPVYHQREKVGSRNALVFYRGKPPNGTKTDWIMHEFKVDNPPPTKRNGVDDMRLDDWVLCKIYYKPSRSCKARIGTEENHNDNQATNQLTNATIDNRLMVQPTNAIVDNHLMMQSTNTILDNQLVVQPEPSLFIDDHYLGFYEGVDNPYHIL